MTQTVTRYEYEDDYERIRIEDDPAQNRRLLLFEDSIQGILQLDQPHKPVLEYLQFMALALKQWFDRHQPNNLLLGGVGIAAVHHVVDHLFPNISQTGVDVNPRVLELAKSWFSLPQSVTLVEDDFRIAMLEYSQRDIIVVDCYTAISIPPQLITKEFKSSVKQALAPRGLALFNLWNGQDHELFFSQLKTLIEVFGKVALRACEADGNILAMASCDDIDRLAGDQVHVFNHHKAEITFPEYVEAEVISDANLSAVLETFGLGY